MKGNAIQGGINLVLGIICLLSAIFCKAYWHYMIAIMCFVLAYLFYTDNNYNESVKQYILKKQGK